MSAKTTGAIWDLVLSVPKRMVLLAMVDHADHSGAHIHAPIAFIAWKTGYSARSVSRIIQELIADGLLILTDAEIGVSNEYQFDFSHAAMKPPYRGRKPKPAKVTHAKMAGVTPAKMSGVVTEADRTPDILAGGHAKMSGVTHAKMANDHDLPYRENHDPPPPPPNTMGDGGDFSDEKPTRTEAYQWLIASGVKSADVAARNQHHDLDRLKVTYKRFVGSAIGDDREKRIGRFVRWIETNGPDELPRPAPPPAPAQPPPRPERRDPTETARQFLAMKENRHAH